MKNTAPPLRLPAAVTQHSFSDPKAMAKALAERVAAKLLRGLELRNTASLVVSGGRSPIAFFESLSTYELDWPRIHIGLVDERCVPPNSSDRNDALVRRHLLRAAAAKAHFAPLLNGETEGQALAAASRGLSALPQPFDIVVLGMGSDGHTASWFADAPETAAAMNPHGNQAVSLVHPVSAAHTRVTLTLPAVLDAHCLLLQVTGTQKRTVLERAGAPDADPAQLPIAAILQQTDIPVHVYFCS